MKNRSLFTTLLLLAAYLLSACGATPQPAAQPPAGQAPVQAEAVEVAFTGLVEAINGDQWTVNGQVLSVDPAVVRDGPFQAGDTVKVEGSLNPDGSLTVSRLEAPSAADLAALPQLGNDNGNANSNDGNTNDANENANSNDDNSNDTNGNDNTNDDNSNDANENSNDDDSNDDNSNGNSNEDGGNSNEDDGNSNDGNSNDDDGNSNEDGGNSNDDGGDDGGNANDGGGDGGSQDDGGGNTNED